MERNKKRCGIILLLPILLVLLLSGCGSIEIETPSRDSNSELTPLKIKVNHVGGCRVDPKTFSARLDIGRAGERDITNYFSYSNGSFEATIFNLPLGFHILWVSASHDSAPWKPCFSWDGTDARQFGLIYKPACMQGLVTFGDKGGTKGGPYPHAPVTAMARGVKLAETVADEEGHFCVEVPLGVKGIKLSVIDGDPPEASERDKCNGELGEGMPLQKPLTCESHFCNEYLIFSICTNE